MAVRTVDVVIPTRDTRELTVRCIRALQEGALRGEIQLSTILVDNASVDGTADAVAELFPKVVVLRNTYNAGFGKAVNRGVAGGRGGYVLILNSDVVARPDAVEKLSRYLDKHLGCVVVAGRLVHLGTDQPQQGFAMRAFPTLPGQLALLLGLERYWPKNPISRRQAFLDFDYGRTQEVEAQPAGACLMCRRSDFDAIGGFDEGFSYWFEDVDLIRRLRFCGSIAYVHDAIFEHVGAASFRQWSRPEIIDARYHGLLRYFGKHHPHREALALRVAVVALALLRAAGWALVDRPRAVAYAHVVRLALRSS